MGQGSAKIKENINDIKERILNDVGDEKLRFCVIGDLANCEVFINNVKRLFDDINKYGFSIESTSCNNITKESIKEYDQFILTLDARSFTQEHINGDLDYIISDDITLQTFWKICSELNIKPTIHISNSLERDLKVSTNKIREYVEPYSGEKHSILTDNISLFTDFSILLIIRMGFYKRDAEKINNIIWENEY